jgi:hypothetical protein|tara:strand:- start:935 stop:1243 length:309 start_codon:yes stop_codon:yes gene_type:complete
MAYILEKMEKEDYSKNKLLDKITELLFQEYDYPELCTDILPELIERIDFYHTDLIDKDYEPSDTETETETDDDDTVKEKFKIRINNQGIPIEIVSCSDEESD